MPAPDSHPATHLLLSAAALSVALAAGSGCSEQTAPAAGPASGAAGTAGSPRSPSAGAVRATAGPADWPIFRGDPTLRGVAGGLLADELTLAWTFQAEQAIVSSPVVANGRVYFGSDDGNLYAVDAASGEQVWAFASQDIIEAPPLVHDGTVYVGSSDYFFYAVDEASGELRWKRETQDRVLGGANVITAADGSARIVVGSYDFRLYCFDAATGETQWTYETENYVNGTPVVTGDRILFGGCDATLHVVSAATGQRITGIPLCGDCHIAGSVALVDGAVYFGHYGNAFVRVDLDPGEVRWTYTDPTFAFFSSPAVGDDVVVFGGRDKELHCADRETGEPRWTYATRRKVDGSPVICGDKVVFGSGDGTLNVLRLETGEAVWTYDIGQSLFSSPAVADGAVYIGSNDGRLYAFGPAPSGTDP